MKTRPVLLLLLLAFTVAGCGYFNSLYNARRQFADAERLRERGNLAGARQAYLGSIEKAAKSYRKYPDSRWSDDALYLITRGRFMLREFPEARAAAAELLARTTDAEIRAGAHAYAGASNVVLAAPDAALIHLDSALAAIDPDDRLNGFARLWRARAHAAAGDVLAAWRDLDAVSNSGDPEFEAVQIERIAFAVAARDSARAAAAFRGLLGSLDARRRLDTINVLAGAAAGVFGPAATREMLTETGAWPDAPRDSLALIRARIASQSGDTLIANRELARLTGGAAPVTAAAARVLLARARLAAATTLEELSEIRALLLPAITNFEATGLIQTMRLVDVLVQRGAATGQALAFFTAAEVARDELGAHQLAHKLFVTFTDIAPQSPWAGKALLAAIAIAPDAAATAGLRRRLERLPSNPYTGAIRGEAVADAYEAAEDRLARSMIALRDEAQQLAAQQEGAVTRAVAVLDSLALVARTDTLRIRCGMMLDTMSLKGIRADSVRTACMRSDSTNVALYLAIDTIDWIPGARGDSIRGAQRGRRSVRPMADSIK